MRSARPQRMKIGRDRAGAYRAVLIVKHADQIDAQRLGLDRVASLVGARLRSGGGNDDVRVVDLVAGAEARLGHVQRQARAIGSGSCLLAGHPYLSESREILFYATDILLGGINRVNRVAQTATGALSRPCGA